MTVNIAGRSVSYAAIVAAVGGVLAIVGAFLDWVTESGAGLSTSVTGMNEYWGVGKSEIILGIVALVLVAAWILKVKIPAIAGLSTIAVLLVVIGVLILVVLALSYTTTFYVNPSLAEQLDAISKAGGGASLGIGFLLEALAGILVIVGGAWALAKKG